jgi:hypothetical protein
MAVLRFHVFMEAQLVGKVAIELIAPEDEQQAPEERTHRISP